MKISDKEKDYSRRVTEKFIELSSKGKIYYPDELKVITHLDKKYNFMPIADYAKEIGKQYKIIQDKIKHRTIAFLEFAGRYFVPKNLNQ